MVELKQEESGENRGPEILQILGLTKRRER
jgi:hypothetical protein